MPGNLLNPETLAKEALQMAGRTGLKCRVLDVRRPEGWQVRGHSRGGRGQSRTRRGLIALEHQGGAKGEAPLVIVGKAITFDSGGISIKPASGMEEMIFDKCGGTAVFGAMQALANLGVKRNVVGILAAAENMPSGTAYRPGDIVTMRSGTTVEVVNTDAEGRMVLGDALWWACNEYKASQVLNLATLTGACGVALGEAAAGVWTNNDTFQAQVLQAAKEVGRTSLADAAFSRAHETDQEPGRPHQEQWGPARGRVHGGRFSQGVRREHPVGALRHRLHLPPNQGPRRIGCRSHGFRRAHVGAACGQSNNIEIVGKGEHRGAAAPFLSKGPVRTRRRA
jgi:hypothetical protein